LLHLVILRTLSIAPNVLLHLDGTLSIRYCLSARALVLLCLLPLFLGQKVQKYCQNDTKFYDQI
jgi:hypothetical protein